MEVELSGDAAIAAGRHFEAGSVAVRPEVFRGRVHSAVPCQVVRGTGDLLVLARWPGVVRWSDTAWIEWLRTGDTGTRARAIEELARGC